MDSHQSGYTQRSLLQNEMIFCKHDTLFSCFLSQIQKSFNDVGSSFWEKKDCARGLEYLPPVYIIAVIKR